MKNITETINRNVNEGVIDDPMVERIDRIVDELGEDKAYEMLWNEIIMWLPNDKVKEFITDFEKNVMEN